LRLSRGMTFKATAAGLNLGGGKAVIIGDPKTDKSEALFRAFGRFLESLKDRFITGEEVGIDANDVEYMFMETRYVCGLSKAHGGGGDPAPVTASARHQGLRRGKVWEIQPQRPGGCRTGQVVDAGWAASAVWETGWGGAEACGSAGTEKLKWILKQLSLFRDFTEIAVRRAARGSGAPWASKEQERIL
jgi:Glu/Leu/Phe/Val dehydrogenase, dimerisation domain